MRFLAGTALGTVFDGLAGGLGIFTNTRDRVAGGGGHGSGGGEKNEKLAH
jgi:hypothetical protein